MHAAVARFGSVIVHQPEGDQRLTIGEVFGFRSSNEMVAVLITLTVLVYSQTMLEDVELGWCEIQ